MWVAVGVGVRVPNGVKVMVGVRVLVGVRVTVGVNDAGKVAVVVGTRVLVGAERFTLPEISQRPSKVRPTTNNPSSPSSLGTPSKSARKVPVAPELTGMGVPGFALVGGVESFPL